MNNNLMRLANHRNDLLLGLLVFELLDEEGTDDARLANLIELGKSLLGSRLELVDQLVRHAKTEGECHE